MVSDIMYGKRERSYLSLFGGKYGMGYSYRSGSLWSGLEWRQQVHTISHFLRCTSHIISTASIIHTLGKLVTDL